MRRVPLPFIALIIAALTACASLPEATPTSILDERTGITLTVTDEPLVLARERRDLAANARDYLTFVAVTRNEAGHVNPFMLVYRWSTIDERVNRSVSPPPGSLVLLADGRDIHLPALASVPADLMNMVDVLWRPDVSQYTTMAYRTDGTTLDFLGSSKQLTAYFDSPDESLPYQIWRDGRAALRRFAADGGLAGRSR